MSDETIEAARPDPNEYKQRIRDRLHSLVGQVNELRQTLDALNVERGVPIKNTVSRIAKAHEYLIGARDYWDYDVIQGNGSTTKAERTRQTEYDLS